MLDPHHCRFEKPRVALLPVVGTTLALLAGSGCSSGGSDASGADEATTNLRLHTVAFDVDNDGVTDQIATFGYDTDGRVITEAFDDGADGSVDVVFNRARDGRSVRLERDVGADGVIEGVTVSTFDEQGRLLAQTRAASDDGVPAENISYTAANGRIVRADVDRGADGDVDLTIRFTYDASGRFAGSTFDSDGDDMIDSALRVLRANDGIVVRLEEDYGNDGGTDFVRVLTYERGICLVGEIGNIASPTIEFCL